MYGALGGFYTLGAITQSTVDGVNQLEASVRVSGFDDFHGEGEFDVFVDDGIARSTATISVTVLPVNDRPTARDDSFATAPNTALVIAGATVLGNDDDLPDVDDDDLPNRGLTVVSVEPSTHGTVSFANDEIRFVPTPGFAGTAPFTYRITDGEDTAEATVRILVAGDNAAPVVVEDIEHTMEGESFDIDVSGLLHNDVDDDGHTLAVIGVGNPDHCAVELHGRTIRVTPNGDNGGTFFGDATFDYTITDGEATATGRVTVQVAPWIR
jgi:hypothetical protein